MPPYSSPKNTSASSRLNRTSMSRTQSIIPLNKSHSPFSSDYRRKEMKRHVKMRISEVIEKHPDLPFAHAVTADWERRKVAWERETKSKISKSDVLRVTLAVGEMRIKAHMMIARADVEIRKLKREFSLEEHDVDMKERIDYEMKRQCAKKLGIDDKEIKEDHRRKAREARDAKRRSESEPDERMDDELFALLNGQDH